MILLFLYEYLQNKDYIYVLQRSVLDDAVSEVHVKNKSKCKDMKK